MTRSFVAAVEGPTDESVLRRVASAAGISISVVHGRKGKAHLIKRLPAFNQAARYSPWIVLMDLDRDAPCAAGFRDEVLCDASPNMHLRIAVREIESWLLADGPAFAKYFGFSQARIPADPDQLTDPKETVVNLCRGSRLRRIVDDVVPRPGSGRRTGPLYASRIIDFAEAGGWRPEVAAETSESLRRFFKSVTA